MPRVTKEPEVRRSELLDAAEDLFMEKGYDHTSVSDIVRRVGVAQGTFYYHFPTKEDVVEALADRMIGAFSDVVREILGDPSVDSIRKMEIVMGRIMALGESRGYLFEYVHREKNAILHQKLAMKALLTFAPMIKEYLVRGMDEGAFSVIYPSVTAEVLIILSEYLQELPLHIKDEADLRMRTKGITALLERILGLKEGTLCIAG